MVEQEGARAFTSVSEKVSLEHVRFLLMTETPGQVGPPDPLVQASASVLRSPWAISITQSNSFCLSYPLSPGKEGTLF